MGDNRDIKKLIHNERIPFTVDKRGWETGSCIVQTIAGREGYLLEVCGVGHKKTTLKTNFFSTELMAVNPDDNQAMASFMGQFGLLDCPYRESSIPLPAADLLIAVEETNNAREHLVTEHIKQQTSFVLDGSGFFSPSSQRFVSLNEAASVLRLLQGVTNRLFSMLDGTDKTRQPLKRAAWQDSVLFEFINKSAGNNNQVYYALQKELANSEGVIWAEPLGTGSLTSAISNQIIETLADEGAWYRCKADDCGRWFKRKRGTDNPRTNSEYCSQTCSERIRKRKRRNSGGTSA